LSPIPCNGIYTSLIEALLKGGGKLSDNLVNVSDPARISNVNFTLSLDGLSGINFAMDIKI